MLDQVIQVFLREWSEAETIRLLISFAALFLPLAVWGAVPPLRRRGEALLVLFGLFTGAYALFIAYGLAFEGGIVAGRLAWAPSPFAVKLGFFHAACGASLLICLALKKIEGTKGVLITLALYAASSAAIHLVEVFGRGRLTLAHMGPPLWHDILLVAIVYWVLRKAEGLKTTVYYVPR